jgi:hypothetical protein
MNWTMPCLEAERDVALSMDEPADHCRVTAEHEKSVSVRKTPDGLEPFGVLAS